MKTINKFADHIIDLCLRYRILPIPVKDVFASASATFMKGDKPLINTIIIKPPTNDVEYAVALHEIGHALDPLKEENQTHNQLVACEIRAWNWAQSNAIEWNQHMDKAREYGVMSHVQEDGGTELGRRNAEAMKAYITQNFPQS